MTEVQALCPEPVISSLVDLAWSLRLPVLSIAVSMCNFFLWGKFFQRKGTLKELKTAIIRNQTL